MGRKINDLEAYIDEAITNIRDDRAITSALLADIFAELKNTHDIDIHRNLGLIASKYVETLQRSNEQLVKITGILNKKQDVSTALDEEDKKELFDMIQGGSGE
jgi:NCAIR mutase (PurE)-related protein